MTHKPNVTRSLIMWLCVLGNFQV